MRICQNCNESFDETFGACPYCGTENADQATKAEQPETTKPDQTEENYDDHFESAEPAPTNIEEEGMVSTAQTTPPQKPKTARIIITAILILVIIIGLLFGLGIVNVSDGKLHIGKDNPYITPTNPDGTPVIVGTNPDGVPIGPDGQPVEVQTTPNGEIVTNPDGTPVIIPNSSAGSSGSSQGASSQGASSKNNSSSSASSNASSSNTSKPNTTGKVTINGNKFNVGDTVVVNVYFKEPKASFVAINAGIHYNSAALEYIDKSVNYMNLPGAVVNAKLENEIIFNCATLQAYDFGKAKVMISASFIIKDTASASEEVTFTVGQILRESTTAGKYVDVPKTDYSSKVEVVKG